MRDKELSFYANDTAMKSALAHNPTVPGTYACLLADVVARWDISADELLEGSSVSPEHLLTPIWSLDYDEFTRLLKRAITLTGEPGLAFHIGLQMKVSCHGLIGYAAMIAGNVREALEIAQTFVQLQSTTIRLRLEEEASFAHLYFDQPIPGYPLGEVGAMLMMLGFATMGEAITGKRLVGLAEVSFVRPAYFDRFEHLLPGSVIFKAQHHRLSFDAAYLDLPLVMADSVAARMAREQCKQALHAMVGRGSLVNLVRELACDETLGFCSMAVVAERLHMSERTLQRQLASVGSSFSVIIDELRQHRAMLMLKRVELSLDHIADRLGYTDSTNFSRAFKRWTGFAPSQFRRRSLARED